MNRSRLLPSLVVVVALMLSGCTAKPAEDAAIGDIPPWIHPVGAKGPVSQGWTVRAVIDGDTVVVTKGDERRTIRLIGVDTPETVDPFVEPECFGKQATAFATKRLLSQLVFLEFDPSQGDLDKYSRTLAYIWLRDRRRQVLFNEVEIRKGFAREYTYSTPYAWQQEFQDAQVAAQAAHVGLWGACD